MSDLNTLLMSIANKSDMKVKYACIIIERNKIISTGFNYYETNRCCKNMSCIL